MARTGNYTADDMLCRIRAKYAGNAYAVLEQVPNITGAGTNSWIDAAVFSLWPSSGLTRSAFEIKVMRGDFVRELQNPRKNAWARSYFNEFWFVAPDGVIKEEELRSGDGWMKPRGDGLVIVRHAKQHAAKTDTAFIAALMRSLCKEREKMKERDTAEVLKESTEHRRVQAFEEACRSFLLTRNEYVHSAEAPEILRLLHKASGGNGLAKIETMTTESIEILDQFRRRMLDTLGLYAQLCAYAVYQRDEFGNKLMKVWGNPDANSIEALRAKLKATSKRNRRENDKSLVSMSDALSEFITDWCNGDVDRGKRREKGRSKCP